MLTDDDLHLFNEGRHFRLYDKLGAHATARDGVAGTEFSVWAPNAQAVSVVGDFNDWDRGAHPMRVRAQSGIWECFVPGVTRGAHYKLHIHSRYNDYRVDKADPFGSHHETPPHTASIVWPTDYAWGDGAWMKSRGERQRLSSPMSIYEVHLGSFMRRGDRGEQLLSYRELATELCRHVKDVGFTHVELLPVMEHPYTGSWGYQVTGYFAATSRYGTPQDLMYLIDQLHQHGIGVILDWVPAHFPSDEHGLGYFDGTHLFEHADPRQGFHPDWKSLIFNYGRKEVRSFLISSAMVWLDRYHADGLRVDGVASMLYRDYSRKAGEWVPNEHGGRENLEAVSLLRELNEAVYASYPDVQTFAEESTAWPLVSRPTHLGGLGFGLKWDLGFMNDTLRYLAHDPVHRKYHHQLLTFRPLYAFAESFVLPLSHDEVVHGKASLLHKMPGDDWQKFANLRLLLSYLYAQPGKKLLFMGTEIAQRNEWNHDAGLDWHLLQHAAHGGVMALVRDLNRLHREEPALHRQDAVAAGFRWVEVNDADHSVLAFARVADDGAQVVAVFNFTPVARHGYHIGVDRLGRWHELLNSDAKHYGGGSVGNFGGLDAQPVQHHAQPYSLSLTLPPLGALYLKAPAAG